VQPWARPRRERRARGVAHPVYDFLFQYYPYSAGQLETWHPAPHEALEDSAPARERFSAPVYVAVDGVIQRDIRAMPHDVRTKLAGVREMLIATRERAPNFGCFGMHEWAMVYRGHAIRHAHIAPLRLPQHEVDELVESRPVACSHFDAFRFFAPEAKPLNRWPLAYATRYDREQPGCIHANMDLYRWAFGAMPWIGSDLLFACFTLASDLRVLDMKAGPYDLRELGFEPVRIETAAGRDEYQRRQQALAERAALLRDELVGCLGGHC